MLPVIAAIVFLSVLIWNKHALFGDSEDLNAITLFTVEQKESGEIYSWNDTAGRYMKELVIAADVKENAGYSIEVSYLNDFGKQKTEKIQDRLNAWFRLHTTYLGKRVTGLRIIIPKRAGAAIDQIQFTNRFEWYAGRMIAVALVCLFLYLILAEVTVREKPVLLFVAFTLCFGMLFIYISGPAHTIWDEEIHFTNAYNLAGGSKPVWNRAARDVAGYIDLNRFNTRTEDRQLIQYLDQKAQEELTVEENTQSLLSFQKIGYFPQVLFLKIGMLLKLRFTKLYAFGKLGSLLVYILVMSLAIHFAGGKKYWLAFLAMCPTLLFTAASYSYDGVCFGFITLGCVLLFCVLRADETEKNSKLAGSIVCLTIGCAAKVIYAPLLLLILIPLFRGKGKKAIAARLFVATLAVLILATFVAPTLYNLFIGNMAYLGDYRGGDTGIVRQLKSLAKHPFAGVRVLFSNVLSFDKFIETGGIAATGSIFPNLLLLNLGYYGVLKNKWCMLLIPTVLYLVFSAGSAQKQRTYLRKKETGFALLVTAGMVFLIWFAMYLGFTEVGEEFISGVQARYYLPLLFPLTCVLPSGWLTVQKRHPDRNLIYGLLPLLFAALSCSMMLRG